MGHVLLKSLLPIVVQLWCWFVHVVKPVPINCVPLCEIAIQWISFVARAIPQMLKSGSCSWSWVTTIPIQTNKRKIKIKIYTKKKNSQWNWCCTLLLRRRQKKTKTHTSSFRNDDVDYYQLQTSWGANQTVWLVRCFSQHKQCTLFFFSQMVHAPWSETILCYWYAFLMMVE